MKLQIAIDVADTERVLKIGKEVEGITDILEVGTPVIVKEGMQPVRALKQNFPELKVLADAKIMDGGTLECTDVCEAGADYVTVLALADDATIQEVVETAHRYGRLVMADLICVKDIPVRARELREMGVDYVCVHTGVDMQKRGRTPLDDLKILTAAIEPEHAAVAGGISLDSLPAYMECHPGIIIAGSSVCNADSVRDAARAMKQAIDHRK